MPLPERKSPRLQGYDYAQAGAYFVTICAYQKIHHFGLIDEGNMQLSEVGKIAFDRWGMIPEFFPSVKLSDYVVMPNHLHGILFLIESHDKRPTLGKIVGNYKGSVTRIGAKRWTSQRKFGKHVIMIILFVASLTYIVFKNMYKRIR